MHGAKVGDVTSESTAIHMSLVENPTVVDASGQVAALPQSEAWIDEWDSYWVELWVNTADGPAVTAGSVDLAYNTDYFTATEIDHGPVYVNQVSGTIDDGIGLVDNIGGATALSDVGGDGYALLARVKFEPPGREQLLNRRHAAARRCRVQHRCCQVTCCTVEVVCCEDADPQPDAATPETPEGIHFLIGSPDAFSAEFGLASDAVGFVGYLERFGGRSLPLFTGSPCRTTRSAST